MYQAYFLGLWGYPHKIPIDRIFHIPRTWSHDICDVNHSPHCHHHHRSRRQKLISELDHNGKIYEDLTILQLTDLAMDQTPAILAVWLYHPIPVYISQFMEQF